MTTPEKSFLGRAFCPEPDTDQGDPFLVEVPESQRGSGPRYLVSVSGPGFPLYGSDDLLDPAGWRRLGDKYPGSGWTRGRGLRACVTSRASSVPG